MATITIDGKSYDLDEFSDEAKARLASLQIVEQKIMDLNNDLIILRTARSTYAKGLSEVLPAPKENETN